MSDYIKIILLLVTCLAIIFPLIKLKNRKVNKDERMFLLFSLIVTIFLVFIVEIKPHHMLRTRLNISNLISYLFYFVIVISYMIRYIKILFRFNYVLIIISYMFFGLANVIDLLSDGKIIVFGYNEIVEDIFHILGIFFWLLFFLDYSKQIKLKDL